MNIVYRPMNIVYHPENFAHNALFHRPGLCGCTINVTMCLHGKQPNMFCAILAPGQIGNSPGSKPECVQCLTETCSELKNKQIRVSPIYPQVSVVNILCLQMKSNQEPDREFITGGAVGIIPSSYLSLTETPEVFLSVRSASVAQDKDWPGKILLLWRDLKVRVVMGPNKTNYHVVGECGFTFSIKVRQSLDVQMSFSSICMA